ncbi:MAG: VCBS repeat-containing protein, partial [Planctomycetes bacterium]|nr:VCBS repeat-containing protein [Planctomycetota bacterium]
TSLGTGLGFVAGAFNSDGWLDVFIANDGMKDHLWINQKDGSFLNDALLAGCAVDQDGIEKAGMGVTIADIDDDGDLDLLVCNLNAESDSLYRNDGGYFTDITSRAGLGAVSRPFTRFGMAWHDFNHDGLLDLYQANGRVERKAKSFSDDPYAEPNLLFRGIAPAKFTEQLPRGGTAEMLYGTSRGAAFGDIDNDGDIDILVLNRDDHVYMLINEAPKQGNWIMFRVLNRHGSDALNAIVSMQVGERKVRGDVRAAYSYLASNDPRVHFGLGNTQKVSNVTITWLDGTKESFGDFDADQIVELRRGQGEIPP